MGSAQFKTGVIKVLFNDSAWHTVDIIRRAEKVKTSFVNCTSVLSLRAEKVASVLLLLVVDIFISFS